MKNGLFIGLIGLFFSLSTLAAPGPDFKEFHCDSEDGSHHVMGMKQNCQDPRYTEWNEDGCYRIQVIDRGETVFDQEILRNVTWRETQQGYYTLYSFDSEEWITIGMILSVKEDRGGYAFRFDQRGSTREEMVMRTKGTCQLTF